jgi:hypothetical protein
MSHKCTSCGKLLEDGEICKFDDLHRQEANTNIAISKFSNELHMAINQLRFNNIFHYVKYYGGGT